MQSLLYAVQSFLLPLLCALAGYRLVSLKLLPEYLASARAAAAHSAEQAHSVWDVLGGSIDEQARARLPEGVGGWVQSALGRLAEWVEAHVMPRVLELSDTLDTASTAAPHEVGAASPLWPAVGIFLVAFLVARGFASVCECAVDAVFVSCLRDEAEYGAAYMSDELRAALELAPAEGRAAEKRRGANGHVAAAEGATPLV